MAFTLFSCSELQYRCMSGFSTFNYSLFICNFLGIKMKHIKCTHHSDMQRKLHTNAHSHNKYNSWYGAQLDSNKSHKSKQFHEYQGQHYHLDKKEIHVEFIYLTKKMQSDIPLFSSQVLDVPHTHNSSDLQPVVLLNVFPYTVKLVY